MNSSTFNGFAGQRLDLEQTDIEAQLHAFIERRRSNPIMRNVAHVLSPSMVTALAQHFYNLNPPPFGGAPRGSIAAGKKIYEEGLPESNVPACSACCSAFLHLMNSAMGGRAPSRPTGLSGAHANDLLW
jgi:hypothetical protein